MSHVTSQPREGVADSGDAESSESLAGRTAIVTGSGSGLGAAEAIALARHGANVVVNDLRLTDSAVATLDAVAAAGGRAEFVAGDVSERATADALMATALTCFGSADIVLNNAGVVRDRMLFNMSDDEWDLVVKVHLRGHFLLTRNAAAHWRALGKRDGQVYGRLINTSSEAGLLGPEGQANYAAAKAGITALTLSASRALSRYGVRANVICPRARTAMTTAVFGDAPDGDDPLSPDHVAQFAAFLASPAASDINGQVFVVYGGMIALLAAPALEQRFDAAGPAFAPGELSSQVGEYFAARGDTGGFAALALTRIAPKMPV